ncbi:acyltransferase family protein [Massilia timonae]|uniref:acyltransferase family protein n=1 Tax=Massilia timonae TaxID=47229 RepID=UPI0028D2CD08|nr:acyltransferase [Massilia timonae]
MTTKLLRSTEREKQPHDDNDMKNTSADGLRGLAALSVTITHFVAAFLPSLLFYNYGALFPRPVEPGPLTDALGSPVFTLFYNGHFPVLIFFVLSGYVLTLPWFERTDAAPVLQRRLWSRYLRLNLPIMAAIALAWLAYSTGLMHTGQAAHLSGSTNWLASFYPSGLTGFAALKEALFGSIVLGNASFLPPLWTLKIEFIGSIYILLFFLAKPARHLLLPMALACLLLHAIHAEQSIYYIALFAGAVLHRVRLTRSGQFAVFAAGLYFGAYQHFRTMYGFLPDPRIWDVKSFYNAIGAACVCAAVLSGWGQGLLNRPLVQVLGRISFSIYLLHFLVLCSLSAAFYTHFPRDALHLGAGFVLYLAACVGAAWLFERWIDRPAIAISRRFGAMLCGDERRSGAPAAPAEEAAGPVAGARRHG